MFRMSRVHPRSTFERSPIRAPANGRSPPTSPPRRNGRRRHQLYFVDSPRQSDPAVAVVEVQAGSTFSFSRPRRLFNLPPTVRGVALMRNFSGEFDVSRDGQQFLFVRNGEGIAR